MGSDTWVGCVFQITPRYSVIVWNTPMVMGYTVELDDGSASPLSGRSWGHAILLYALRFSPGPSHLPFRLRGQTFL